jgi:hypothetical protein
MIENYYKFIWVVIDEFGTYRKAFPTKKDAVNYCMQRYSGKHIIKYQEVNDKRRKE